MSAATILPSFVDGRFLVGDGADVPLVQPASGETIGFIWEAGTEGVEAAVKSAKAAFNSTHSDSRASEPFAKGGGQTRRACRETPDLICDDIGKPIRSAKFEVIRGSDLLRGCAEAVSQFGGETVPLDAVASGTGCLGFVQHVPYGVVAAITPFNAPVNLLLQKVGPAVAAGNAVVAKPAPAGHRVAVQLAELFVDAGWPAGLLNVVGGDRVTALALAAHRDVRAVSVTGGVAAGEALARAAGAKKFVAELRSRMPPTSC